MAVALTSDHADDVTASTASSVAVGLLILVGCGDASTPPAAERAPAISKDAAVPSTVPQATSAPTPETRTTEEAAPITPPPSRTASTAVQATFEVEGVTLTVTLPDGAVPDPIGMPAAPVWVGRLDVDVATGAISADGFNALVDTRQPVETRTAGGTALMLVGPDDAPETATGLSERPGTEGRTMVTITKSNLPDDSIHAVRYQIELRQMPDTLFRFIGGEWAQQCQPGRGHQDFTTELCT